MNGLLRMAALTILFSTRGTVLAAQTSMMDALDSFHDGLVSGDTLLLKEVIIPGSYVRTAAPADTLPIPVEAWISTGIREKINLNTRQVLSADTAGTAAAVVSVLKAPRGQLIHFVSMLRVGDGWKVANVVSELEGGAVKLPTGNGNARSSTKSAAKPTTAIAGDVMRTIYDYFQGVTFNDSTSVDRAFHARANLLTSQNGARLRHLGFSEWRTFARRPAAANAKQRTNAVELLYQTSNTAVVKAVLTWPEVTYVDYLTLMRIDGAWRIVNKIWHVATPHNR